MPPLARTVYACVLTTMLVPALARKLSREGRNALRVAERLASSSPAGSKGGIWLNFASVGELNAVSDLAAELQNLTNKIPIFATCSSEAAYALAPSRLGFKAQVLPLDFAWTMSKMFKRISPKLCILAEQELWPNMISQAQKRNVPLVVVNARLGKRTARRHAKWHSWSKSLFTSLSLVCAADQASAARFQLLGAPKVVVTGNMKFDRKPEKEKVSKGLELRKRLQAANNSKPIVLLASTRADASGSEEAMLLDALATKLDSFTLIVLPRHPHRQDEVATILSKRNINFVRFSTLKSYDSLPNCLLADTLGQMDVFMAATDVVFIGASLINQGGQNPMEAFVLGKPVICGPHTHNFADLIYAASSAQASVTANDANKAANEIIKLADDEQLRKKMGANAIKLAKGFSGATARTMELLEPYLTSQSH